MLENISKETAVQKILNSEGRMFGIKWVTKNGAKRYLNCKMMNSIRTTDRRNQDKIFGLLSVKASRSGAIRRVDSRTISFLSIDKKKFKVV